MDRPLGRGYSRLCGATGITVDRRDQLDRAMTRLFAADGPAMLHIRQDPELL
jgi:pyruvate oxidase